MKNVVLLVLGIIVLTGCGGGSTSSEQEDRNAVHCLGFTSSGLVTNSCDFAIVARTFGGTSTPVTVPANSSVADPDANITTGFAGACRAPFTPVTVSTSSFSCQ